jgi:hypothetical protein
LCAAAYSRAAEPFAIEVVDGDTGRGVPLVGLKTVAGRTYYTDNAGLVAIDEPGLLGEEAFFSITSHGYEFAADGFGIRGKRVKVEAGGVERLSIRRKNLAERLYRLTGQGLYEHSVRLGRPTPLEKPLLNAQVTGCDSTQSVVYRGSLFSLWGDTNRLSYPLGNFRVTAATSQLPSDGGLAPDVGMNYRYFGDGQGFVKAMAPFKNDGPVWLTALVTLKDEDGQEHLVATYLKIRGTLEVIERGLCEFDDDEQAFREVYAFPRDARLTPEGHCFRHQADGQTWLYVGEATPTLRMPDRYESWRDPKTYEAVKSNVKLRDVASGKPVRPHHGHVDWNEARKKWVSIFTESGGATSYLGEIWYAEAASPEGPWERAVQLLTHDKYSFYNPLQHPYFADDRYLYFEGTYVTTFSGNEHPTPLYDYNQIMYRVDLHDTRMNALRE